MEAWFNKRLTDVHMASTAGGSNAAASQPGTKRRLSATPNVSACCGARIRRDKCTSCHTMMNKAARVLPTAASSKKPAASNQPSGADQWTAAHDKYLYAHRNDPVSALAAHFSRGDGGIKSRLEHLRDPTHAAYQRLHTGGASSACGARTSGMASKRRMLESSSLNQQQRSAVHAASAGESFFLTGGAGTGKSFTLSHIVQALEGLHGQRGVFVTGSTGIAACHVGGTTLHSFAGIGLGKEDVGTLVSRVLGNRNAAARWQECRALVIDEVSMLDGDLFDKLEAIGRRMLDPARPFGGLQLILVGDFFQLPPVSRGPERCSFLFQAACYGRVVARSIVLREVFRQKHEGFVALLNEMRKGSLSAASVRLLQEKASRGRAEAAAASTAASLKLFPQNEPADRENFSRLSQLTSPTHTYICDEAGAKMDGCLAPPTLELKLAARVLLLKNLDTQLVNGSRGVVIGFSPAHAVPDVRTAPPAPSEACAGELGGGGGGGSAAGGASGGASSSNAGGGGGKAENPTGLYPLVRFGNGVERVLTPEEWTVEQGGKVIGRRVQVPLKLAWAIRQAAWHSTQPSLPSSRVCASC